MFYLCQLNRCRWPVRLVVHRIDREFALFGDPAGFDHVSTFLGGGESIKLLPVRIHERGEVRFADASWVDGLFLWHGGNWGKGWVSSKVLRLEVADDGGGVSHGDLDVRLQYQARAFKRGFALLKDTAHGIEARLQGALDLGK